MADTAEGGQDHKRAHWGVVMELVVGLCRRTPQIEKAKQDDAICCGSAKQENQNTYLLRVSERPSISACRRRLRKESPGPTMQTRIPSLPVPVHGFLQGTRFMWANEET